MFPKSFSCFPLRLSFLKFPNFTEVLKKTEKITLFCTNTFFSYFIYFNTFVHISNDNFGNSTLKNGPRPGKFS